MHYTASTITFMGFDFQLAIEFSISDFGARATWDDPGWGPEFDIHSITLQNEDPDYFGSPAHEATGELFRLLANLRSTDDAILDAIAGIDPYF